MLVQGISGRLSNVKSVGIAKLLETQLDCKYIWSLMSKSVMSVGIAKRLEIMTAPGVVFQLILVINNGKA